MYKPCERIKKLVLKLRMGEATIGKIAVKIVAPLALFHWPRLSRSQPQFCSYDQSQSLRIISLECETTSIGWMQLNPRLSNWSATYLVRVRLPSYRLFRGFLASQSQCQCTTMQPTNVREVTTFANLTVCPLCNERKTYFSTCAGAEWWTSASLKQTCNSYKPQSPPLQNSKIKTAPNHPEIAPIEPLKQIAGKQKKSSRLSTI